MEWLTDYQDMIAAWETQMGTERFQRPWDNTETWGPLRAKRVEGWSLGVKIQKYSATTPFILAKNAFQNIFSSQLSKKGL